VSKSAISVRYTTESLETLAALEINMAAFREFGKMDEWPMLLRVVGCLPLRAELAIAGEV